ncbi:MAG: trypsin-like peptidase protein [Actinomycetota bacterium]|nr:trypsin-like peptidase protein [Actinomycetota bacterium]
MSQNTGPQPETWHAPWAVPASERPAATAVDSAPRSDQSGVPDPYAPSSAATDQTAVYPSQPVQAGVPGGFSTPASVPAGGFPPPAGPPPRREPRRPGWGGVLAVGVGAAVLSSLLTAGMFTLSDRDNTSPALSSSAPGPTGAQSAPLVSSSGGTPDWVSVAGAVEPSVVSVQVTTARGGGEGSGIILDAQGRILTNHHVVAEAGTGGAASGTELSVVLSDGRAYPAEIVGTDSATDLAVIKMDKAPSGLKPATFGDSSAAKVGDPVMALGNPLGLSDTVTTGIVSALNRPVRASSGQGGNGSGGGEPVITNAIQTDAAINPGNSGGALVDSSGRVIGITSSIASMSGSFGGQAGNIGLGFAIPINEAKQVSDELISTGKVQHAYLGVTLEDSSVALDGARREAAVIQSVSAGTPAAAAGVKTGDAVIAFNGRALDSADSLVGTIRAIKPGTQVTLTIVRNGSAQEVKVTLAQRPATR